MASDNEYGSAWLNFGVALVSFAVLSVELSLIRVMDVILAPSTGYMVLTSAMFALGLGGIYLYFFPANTFNASKRNFLLSIGFAVVVLLITPIFNLLPFSIEITEKNKIFQIASWAGMYLTITFPFLVIGLILAQVFKSHSLHINKLYFYDLIGAGAACLIFIPLIPFYGPAGILFLASSAALIASLCFYRPKKIFQYVIPVIALLISIIPLLIDNYVEFKGHANKRNNDLHIQQGKRIIVKWDAVSKLDVFKDVAVNALLFSLDGGQQGSWLKKFNGDIRLIEKKIDDGKFNLGRGSAVHYLLWKQGIKSDVLLIGSSAGGDIKRALSFDAKHVDAVELVDAIVNTERGELKKYGGGWYDHPLVTAIVGEGRSYLRSVKKKYDIIQMFSSHTSSSVESGSGAAQTVYLQTVEAYKEYFEHLSKDGALQINHHIYPRMLTTAAQAWNALGRKEFWRHALVIEPAIADTLPTMIIKMKPWKKEEIKLIFDYMNRGKKSRVDRPIPHHPSKKIYDKSSFSTSIESSKNTISGVEFRVGIYRQKHLSYNIKVMIKDETGKVIARSYIKGKDVKENDFVEANFSKIKNTKGKIFTIEVDAPDAKKENGFSIWLSKKNRPVLNLKPRVNLPHQTIVFHPLETNENIVPIEFLSYPFPYHKEKKIPWNISPVTDESPYFSMVRKTNTKIFPGKKNMIDRNTADLLNYRLRNGVPGDWLHLYITICISIFFSFVFIVLPLVGTSVKSNKWTGMGKDIFYFSSLGMGFIMVEVVFIQLFKKLIGYPTHTFVVVICSLLISAGIGSAFSKKFVEFLNGKLYYIFVIIITYGLIFTFFYENLFFEFLGKTLTVRIMIAILMIAPLGFFLGMPFPLGILGLSGKNVRAIPWAWAINGFFTVVGGLITILISILMGFSVVLYLAFIVYGGTMIVSYTYRNKIFLSSNIYS